jgi:hypothetical protein
VDVSAVFTGEQHDEWIAWAGAVLAMGALGDRRRLKMIVDPAHHRAAFLRPSAGYASIVLHDRRSPFVDFTPGREHAIGA